MALINPAQADAGTRIVAAVAQRVVRVWHDADFQGVLRREAKRFVVNVASEARAASLRIRG